VTTSPVIEAGESGRGNWLRERRLRLALLIGLVESLLVLWGGLGWFWVLALAAVAVVLDAFAARGARFHALREIAWIFAASQLIAVIVPVLWEIAKFFATQPVPPTVFHESPRRHYAPSRAQRLRRSFSSSLRGQGESSRPQRSAWGGRQSRERPLLRSTLCRRIWRVTAATGPGRHFDVACVNRGPIIGGNDAPAGRNGDISLHRHGGIDPFVGSGP
jgi:hypothetical protein